jgi:choline dehydrogenase-like flavoprotein
MPRAFDVVVVGGGTAGCVLAGRLSERPLDVCLVEAGPDYGPYAEGGWPADILDARWLAVESHCWETDREDRSQLRARILGGCSAHNACILIAGAPADYDEWGEGWSYAVIEPYLRRAEQTFGLRTLDPDELSPWHHAWAEATGDDAIVHPANLRRGWTRWNAGFAYVDPGEPDDPGRRPRRPGAAGRRSRRRCGHVPWRGARPHRRPRLRCLRHARRAAAKRHRARGRAAGRRGARRPRRYRHGVVAERSR